jgi:hypothetical protein
MGLGRRRVSAEVTERAGVAQALNPHVLALLRQPPAPLPAPSPYAHLLSRFAKNAPQIGDLPPKRFTVGAPGSQQQAEAYVDWTSSYWRNEERARLWLETGKIE